MSENQTASDKYPNYPPYDSQVKFYEGATLRVDMR